MKTAPRIKYMIMIIIIIIKIDTETERKEQKRKEIQDKLAALKCRCCVADIKIF